MIALYKALPFDLDSIWLKLIWVCYDPQLSYQAITVTPILLKSKFVVQLKWSWNRKENAWKEKQQQGDNKSLFFTRLLNF